MAYEIVGTHDGKLVFTDLLSKYGPPTVGRWSIGAHGGIPDRCATCPLGDIRPAVGFTQRRSVVFGKRTVVREGYCGRHQPKPEEG